MSTTTTNLKQLASDAIDLQRKVNELMEQLNVLKDQLREAAGDDKLHIIVSGKGEVKVMRAPGVKIVTTFVVVDDCPEERLNQLLSEGIVEKQERKRGTDKPTVQIRPI